MHRLAIWPLKSVTRLQDLGHRPERQDQRQKWGTSSTRYLRRRSPPLDFGILGKGQHVVHIDAQIPNGILDLTLPEQQLDRPQVGRRRAGRDKVHLVPAPAFTLGPR